MQRMTKTVTLREANQSFARCIREVEGGEEFVITRNGTPSGASLAGEQAPRADAGHSKLRWSG